MSLFDQTDLSLSRLEELAQVADFADETPAGILTGTDLGFVSPSGETSHQAAVRSPVLVWLTDQRQELNNAASASAFIWPARVSLRSGSIGRIAQRQRFKRHVQSVAG